MSIPHAVIEAHEGWVAGLRDRLRPGAHVVVIGASPRDCVEGRREGFSLRDTVLVFGGIVMPAVLFRLPFEGTVVDRVVSDGTGGLWVDGCRIAFRDEADRTSALPGSMPNSNDSVGTFQTRDRRAEKPESFQSSIGRWPTNLLLVHRASCRQDGVREVRASAPGGPAIGGRPRGVYGEGDPASFRGNGSRVCYGEGGTESVASWKCEPGCPVSTLDMQSGILKSGGYPPGGVRRSHVSTYGAPSLRGEPLFGASEGGASRFYPQCVDAAAVRAWLVRLASGAA